MISTAPVPSLLPLVLFALAALPAAAQTPQIPRPEHPRPDRERAEWITLNGTWEFAETDDDQDEGFLSGGAFPEKIIVPFARESRLSGLERKGFIRNVWYRRAFRVPEAWKSPRVVFHIGASDYRTRVWVNGRLLGVHRGGNSPIALDATDALRRDADNIVVVHAFDDARSGLQPLGKQSDRPESHGIFYTRTTGIWQSVWLEGTGAARIDDFTLETDPARGRVEVRGEIGLAAGLEAAGLELYAEVTAEGKPPVSETAPADWRLGRVELTLPEPRLWSPADPFLYNLRLTLRRGGEPLDEVKTWFGLRTVSIQGRAVLLNGKPVFQRLVLDQGFYPDGVWTAPSDAALRGDIELSMAAGFNGARLHQKVFEPRFLYWADKLGYLCWGEYPSYGADYKKPEVHVPILEEWTELLRRDRNHPAIVGWCPFNETPPEAAPLQRAVLALTRAVDPSRPVIETSGWTHSAPDPEILDAHDYDQKPESFRARWNARAGSLALPSQYGGPNSALPFFVSEYGGIGWFNPGEKAWGYGVPKTLDEFYSRYEGLTNALLDNRFMFGFCYTQLTDVEQERNGVYRYDRSVKFDLAKLKAINSRPAAFEREPALNAGPKVAWTPRIGAAVDGALAAGWRFTTAEPSADWNQPAFDASAWSPASGGFGKKAGWLRKTGQEWTAKDIWLRRAFAFDGDPAKVRAMLVVHYDNAAEAYLNGKEIWRAEGWNDDYANFDVTAAFAAAAVKGENLLAIHCRQDDGGQFIDAALLTAALEP